MSVPEKRDEARDAEPKASVKRATGVGLSPAVEKMFGALVDEEGATGVPSPSEAEAQRASRPGAA